ncbi:serine hydrolase domain-containing protein [Dapis sp. BLCC M229]|uniref:serine hydrolase domain-containing protein n=1 Tax=Dapis sp. BLCC M229 TaxID=3400188 RepID=UPI003CECA913
MKHWVKVTFAILLVVVLTFGNSKIAFAVTPEYQFGPDASWKWFSDLSTERLTQELDKGFRIVDIEVAQANPLRLDVVLVSNKKPYSRAWWWWPSLEPETIKAKLDEHKARLIQLKPFRNDKNQLRFAVVMVSNTGDDHYAWSWFTKTTWNDLLAHRNQTNDRILDIESWTTTKGEKVFSAVTVSGKSGTPTRLLSHSKLSSIDAWLDDNPQYKIIDMERLTWGGWAAIVTKDTGRQWRHYNIDASEVSHIAGRHYARLIDLESVKVQGKKPLYAIYVDNGLPVNGKKVPSFKAADAYDRRLKNFVKQYNLPGLGVALVKDDRLIFTRGYGLASMSPDEQATPLTKFRIGSCSKVFAAASMLRLIAQGAKTPEGQKVTMNTRIFRDIIVPSLGLKFNQYDSWYDGITVAHILRNISGLDDKGERVNPITNTIQIAKDLKLKHTPSCRETVLWMMDKSGQLTPGRTPPMPGSRYEYYNTGPCIASLAVEILSAKGKSDWTFEKYLDADLLKAAGVQGQIVPSSDYFSQRAPNEAQHYSSLASVLSGKEWVDPRLVELASTGKKVKIPYGGIPLVNGTAPGGLAASPVGWAKFITQLNDADGKLIGTNGWSEMTTDSPLKNYGTFVSLNKGNGDVYHNGSVGGGFGWFVIKSDGTVWVVAANASSENDAINQLNTLMIEAYKEAKTDIGNATGDLFPSYGLAIQQ